MVSEPFRGGFLLDTHVWIWYVEADERMFSSAVREALIASNIERGLWVSVMSAWEVAMLDSKRRVNLSMAAPAWIEQALSLPGIRLSELSPAIAIESTRLPSFGHRDAVDQILVATARLTGATLVTRDHRILDYAAKGYLRALDAAPSTEAPGA
jgi:PIN domain nuclease of toxin-antitoxin system